MKLILEAPINSLSFGNVTINILRELHKMGHEVGVFPMGNPDFSAFTFDPAFKDFIQNGFNNRFQFLKKDIPALKIWHLNGADNRKTSRQYLYSFYECNQPTPIELTISKLQDKIIFSSSYASTIFNRFGVNSAFSPLGFDPDFHATNKKYLEGVTHFGLMGKCEKRKHTSRIIQAWAKKYGNNPSYQLSCCITNPFFKPEDMQQIIAQTLQGKRYTNINFLPRLQTNIEVNDFLNAIDIDLGGLSGGEGWNLPSFNATCLGKWSIVLNATSHTDWATKENSILIEPSSQMPVEDGFFFKTGADFNQGTFFAWTEEEVIAAMELAETKVGQVNTEGQKLATELTYRRTVEGILAHISS